VIPTTPVLMQIMRAMVLAWEPDWGVITPDNLRDTLSETGRAGTFMGWMTYFSRNRGEAPLLPEPMRREPVEDKGSLVVLSPKRISASNSEHVALARRAQDLFLAKGLLEPVVPRHPAG
jgi:Immunity protein 52